MLPTVRARWPRMNSNALTVCIARRLLGEQGARDCARRLGAEAPPLLVLAGLRSAEFLAALDLIERNFLKGSKKS
jgi:hypothetical protein